MIAVYNSCWAWVAWIVIGLVGGILASCFIPGKKIGVFDMFIGVVGAIAGGWSSAFAIGDSTKQTFVIAALVAMLVAGGALWLYNTLLSRGR